MKTLVRLSAVLILAAIVVTVYDKALAVATPPRIQTATVARGDVVMNVVATGTLQATRTIDIGTQVSGIVKRLYVDYNYIVKQGELLAEIDPQQSQMALDSAKANEQKAEIDLQSAQDAYDLDAKTAQRDHDLLAQSLITEQDNELADLQVKQDQATIDQDKAAVTIAKDNIRQAEVTLGFCRITAPIDGVIIARNADEGQTVTSSLSVPSLYIMATDISNLELAGQIDEADIGKLHPGQEVSFTVDAYPNRTFHGTMTHVRLYAQTVNNVVTYQAIVAVPNADLRLLPSMTAHLTVEVARASNALKVPNVALRFRPSREMFAALNQPPIDLPPLVPVGAPAMPSPAAPAAPGQAGAAITAESTEAAKAALAALSSSSASPMIDVLFRPMPHPQSRGQVWIMADGHLKNVPLTLGVTDGTWTEVIDGDLPEGQAIVTSMALPAAKTSTPTASSPLMPGRPTGPGATSAPARGR